MKKIFFLVAFFIFFKNAQAAHELYPDVAYIKVGECSLEVYLAKDKKQKTTGMLVFSDKTFDKDGMLFTGDIKRRYYFHTVGMKMVIRIMGVDRLGENKYRVNGEATYAPAGLESVEIVGESVLEIPETLYQSKFKQCLYK